MSDLIIENIRMDADIGDGIAFTVDVHGVAHRFFVTRETLGELERSRLTNSHDLVASFERQRGKIQKAVIETLKYGTSHSITFLKTSLFTTVPAAPQAGGNREQRRDRT